VDAHREAPLQKYAHTYIRVLAEGWYAICRHALSFSQNLLLSPARKRCIGYKLIKKRAAVLLPKLQMMFCKHDQSKLIQKGANNIYMY
jgi:hypothetical protein